MNVEFTSVYFTYVLYTLIQREEEGNDCFTMVQRTNRVTTSSIHKTSTNYILSLSILLIRQDMQRPHLRSSIL